MKAATCQSEQIGVRMKAAREVLGLTQDGLAQAVGGSKRGIQDNEARNRVPGGEVICGLVCLGINANWLLTGEGPMLLNPAADLGRLMAEARGDAPIQQIAENIGVPAINLLDMERGKKIADAETIHDYVRLCGAEPGLLFASRDRALVADGMLTAPTKPTEDAVPINIDALVQAFCVSLATAPKGESPEQSARKAVQFYIYCNANGLLDPGKAAPGKDAA